MATAIFDPYSINQYRATSFSGVPGSEMLDRASRAYWGSQQEKRRALSPYRWQEEQEQKRQAFESGEAEKDRAFRLSQAELDRETQRQAQDAATNLAKKGQLAGAATQLGSTALMADLATGGKYTGAAIDWAKDLGQESYGAIKDFAAQNIPGMESLSTVPTVTVPTATGAQAALPAGGLDYGAEIVRPDLVGTPAAVPEVAEIGAEAMADIGSATTGGIGAQGATSLTGGIQEFASNLTMPSFGQVAGGLGAAGFAHGVIEPWTQNAFGGTGTTPTADIGTVLGRAAEGAGVGYTMGGPIGAGIGAIANTIGGVPDMYVWNQFERFVEDIPVVGGVLDAAILEPAQFLMDAIGDTFNFIGDAVSDVFSWAGDAVGSWLCTEISKHNRKFSSIEVKKLKGLLEYGMQNYPEMTGYYFKNGHKLIEKIVKSGKRNHIMKMLDDRMIQPCLYLMDNGKMDSAFRHYEYCTKRLYETFYPQGFDELDNEMRGEKYGCG